MKIFLLSLFVAAAFAAPAPLDEEIGEPVELIVNGLAEGEPLELGDVLDIKVKEHVDGQVVAATNLLHPLTAVGLAEAAAAQAPEPVQVIENPEVIEIQPEPVQVIEIPEVVEVQPKPIELPAPVIPSPPINIPALLPETIEHLPPVNLPALLPETIEHLPPVNLPALLPETIDINKPLPEVAPEVIELPIKPEIELPEPVAQFPNGEVFNDGVVQVTVNAPESGVLASVQSWFSMVLNYFNGDAQTTHQIV